jgi:hypothetical protein
MVEEMLKKGCRRRSDCGVLDRARGYVKRGCSVIPLQPKGKEPNESWKRFQKQRPTEAELARWFFDGENNIGIVTGEISGLSVVDCDSEEAIKRAKSLGVNGAPCVATGKGMHFYFEHHLGARNFAKRPDLPGIDFRGEGGYVVAPPSVHPSGACYEWSIPLNGHLPELPDWLLNGRGSPIDRKEKEDFVKKFLRSNGGERNSVAAQMVGEWARCGISEDAAEEMALGLANRKTNAPLDEEELEKLKRTVHSIYETDARNHPGFSTDLVVSARELVAKDIPSREELVDGLLFTQSLGMIFAPRGRGKTYFALHMAAAIASGTPFLRWNVSKQRRCLYVDGELPAIDLQERVKRICSCDVPTALDLISSEFFYDAEKQPLTLNDETHQKHFLKMLDQLKETGRQPEVMFLDNISSMTFGTEENSNSEQDSFLRFLLELRHLGYSVIAVHHIGKDGNQRGASRREDFLDISIKLADPVESSSGGAAKFILQFSKIRRKMPVPSSLECELCEDEQGKLIWVTSEVERGLPKWVECLRVLQTRKPTTQAELAEMMGSTNGTISKYLKKARSQGLLEGMEVTTRGTNIWRKFMVSKRFKMRCENRAMENRNLLETFGNSTKRSSTKEKH